MEVAFQIVVLLLIATSTTADLDDEVRTLRSEVNALEKKLDTFSNYCRMLQSDICGPCTCLDDYTLPQKYYCDCQNLQPQRDCLQHYQTGGNVDGLYLVNMNHLRLVQVYCDQTTDGGGWTVFQRRMDGTVNFYRNWREYKTGFGKLQHEFYLGNENLYYLTLQALYRSGSQLRVDMVDWNDNRIYAKYYNFHIGNDYTDYTLHVRSYSGNAGDSLTIPHDGKKFSTYDLDNDEDTRNCAKTYRGAWWFRDCFSSHLNGEYMRNHFATKNYYGIHWQSYKSDYKYSMKAVEMKVRRK
ncbi:fibrinogen C domain-containing protein 1-B-like [Hydractinia symbiolongicarpus]|uniref:fibrinogen C domain-containing protein 1-B-like n=1 Tax=Hydractinia symbiolongicarpus TaxID=13093 RepID=UPI0025518544|nr:fibrinogen C domain-containing protein 1-B-like [Hydractinia symbiolongicarpus]